MSSNEDGEVEREVAAAMSDSSTSSESDSNDIESVSDAKQAILEMSKSTESDLPPRTPNEVAIGESNLPPLPKDVNHTDEIKKAGSVMSFHGSLRSVVVAASDSSPLAHGSVICTEKKRLIGRIEEVFGPVIQPYYLVRVLADPDPVPVPVPVPKETAECAESGDKAAEATEDLESTRVTNSVDGKLEELSVGMDLFVVENQASRINVASLDTRGSDASNPNNEEVEENEVDYSDDEAEKTAKRAAKDKRRGVTSATSEQNGFAVGSQRQGQGRGRGRRRDRSARRHQQQGFHHPQTYGHQQNYGRRGQQQNYGQALPGYHQGFFHPGFQLQPGFIGQQHPQQAYFQGYPPQQAFHQDQGFGMVPNGHPQQAYFQGYPPHQAFHQGYAPPPQPPPNPSSLPPGFVPTKGPREE